MFINTSIFKKMCTNAYKGNGLDIEHSQGLYSIGSSWWQMEVKDTMLTNKVKSIIIELIGEFPEDGTGYTYTKDSSERFEQMLIEGTKYMDLESDYNLSTDIYEKTPLYINNDGVICCILQNPDTGDKKVINSLYMSLIDKLKIDNDAGETVPQDIRKCENMMIWSNNIMSFGCYIRSIKYKGELELFNRIRNVDLLYDRSLIDLFKENTNEH